MRLKTKQFTNGNGANGKSVQITLPMHETTIHPNKVNRRDWTRLNDGELVEYAKRFITDRRIKNRRNLNREDSGLYTVLFRRKLLDEIKFDRNERAWRNYTDDELVAYAQKLIEDKKIKNKKGISIIDASLYTTLYKRKLINRLKFEEQYRNWTSMKDKEIISHAKKFVKRRGIKNRKSLEKEDSGLHHVLVRRKLLDRIKFEENRIKWSKYNDDNLVRYAENFIKENNIDNRTSFEEKSKGLCGALRKRGLYNKLRFENDEKKWSNYSDDEIIAYAQIFIKNKEIKNKHGLEKERRGLYATLLSRRLLSKLKFERVRKTEKQTVWVGISNDNLTAFARQFIKERKIKNRFGLSKANRNLYNALKRRNLLGRIKFEKYRITKPKGFYSKMSDEQLVIYAQKFIDQNRIRNRKNLERSNKSLYYNLIRRKLLNNVFLDIRRSHLLTGIEDIIAAVAKFQVNQ